MNGIAEVQIYAAGLAGLPGMTPVRLAKLMDGFHPVLAWKAVRVGTHPADPRRRFTSAARTTDLGDVEARYRRAGVEILLPDMRDYPSMLVGIRGRPPCSSPSGSPPFSSPNPGWRSWAPVRQPTTGARSRPSWPAIWPLKASWWFRDWLEESTVRPTPAPCGRVATRCHRWPLSAPVWTSRIHRRIVSCGRRWPPEGPSSPSRLSARSRTQGCSRPEIGSSPPFPMWWWWSRATEPGDRCTRPTPQPGDRFPSARCRARSGAAPQTGPMGCWWTGARRCAMPPMYWWRSPWPGPARRRSAPKPGRSGARRQSHRSAIDGTHAGRTVPRTEADPPEADPPEADPPEADPPEADPTHRAVLDAIDDVPTRFETILIRTGLSIAATAEACDRLVERGSIISGAGWWSRNQQERSLLRN